MPHSFTTVLVSVKVAVQPFTNQQSLQWNAEHCGRVGVNQAAIIRYLYWNDSLVYALYT